MRTFNQAIQSTLNRLMMENERVVLLGLGVADPKRFFGTTDQLLEKFGQDRVFECPTSENGYLGHALGLALEGFTPIVHFQRMDFMCYALDQLINNIAKWKSMFDEDQRLSLVIRSLIGMGWGQGAQHSQNLAPLLAQIPGLQVVVPSCPESAAGLLEKAARGRDPVLFVEHRWLQSLSQDQAARRDFAIGQAIVRRPGDQVTVVSWSYGIVEALRFCGAFPAVSWEIVDLLSLSPLDINAVIRSVKKTGRLVVWEPAWTFGGIGAEIVARLSEEGISSPVMRIGYPSAYPASAPAGAKEFYPSPEKIVQELNSRFSLSLTLSRELSERWPIDQDVPEWNPWIAG